MTTSVLRHYLPTRSFSEDNIVFVQVSVPLHKLDASEVLPVPHCLLEERLVGTTEVTIYFVRNDAVLPDSLLTVGGGTNRAMSLDLI